MGLLCVISKSCYWWEIRWQLECLFLFAHLFICIVCIFDFCVCLSCAYLASACQVEDLQRELEQLRESNQAI